MSGWEVARHASVALSLCVPHARSDLLFRPSEPAAGLSGDVWHLGFDGECLERFRMEHLTPECLSSEHGQKQEAGPVLVETSAGHGTSTDSSCERVQSLSASPHCHLAVALRKIFQDNVTETQGTQNVDVFHNIHAIP